MRRLIPWLFLTPALSAFAWFKFIPVLKGLRLRFDTVIFVAGLSTVNRELYDAASIDGAGWLARLRHVTLPALLPTIAIVLLLGLIRGFRVFTEVYATTGGGPAGATEVIMTHVYKIGFDQFDYGYASAVSFLLFTFTMVLTLVYLAWHRRILR